MTHAFQKLVVPLALAAALAVSGSASAQQPPRPPGTSAIAQYLEAIPTSDGRRIPGVGTSTSRPLPPDLRAKLAREGGRDQKTLTAIASTSAYGAPQRLLPKQPAEPGQRSALGAAISAATGSGSTSGFVLLSVLLAAITLITVIVAARRANLRRR